MFLTTNRVSDFDGAILSRIHLMLKYQELGISVRNQIWEYILHRAHTSQGGAVIARMEIERLAKAKLNSRQVSFAVHLETFPLIHCFLDQERGYYRSRSSYQEKYSGGLFPSPTGGQGERELHPRIQRH